MRLGMTYRAATLLLFASVFACELKAQTTTSGALAGVVIDQTNAVVPDADVEIKDLAKGTAQSTKTDTSGVSNGLQRAQGTRLTPKFHAPSPH